MSMIAYTVICRIESPEKAKSWLDWLQNGHVQDVIRAGAVSAQIVKIDNDTAEERDCDGDLIVSPVTYEVRYLFNNRGDIDLYLKEHAPRLRQEGLERFPVSDGFTYSRTIGEVLYDVKGDA